MSNEKLEEFNKKLKLPSSWAQPGFMETFEVVSTNGKKIKQREYQLSGALPVIDQGEDLIGGYTDKLDAAIKVDEPLIVFGDHTRVFKFIKHDFAPGADGVKVLRTSHSLMPKYAYYACQALRLPNRGYARHFSVLKKFRFPVAPLNEQRRIVEKIESLFVQLDHGEASLRDVQKLLARYRQSVLKAAVTGQLTADWRAENADRLEPGRDLLKRILQARRENWQGRGKYKEPGAPDTSDLADLPEGWVWATVEQLAEVIGGLTKNSKRSALPIKKPMLRVANVYQNRLDLDEVHDTGVTEGELPRVTLRNLDLLVVEGNGSKGQIGRMAVWRDEIPGAVHQNHLIKVRLVDKLLAEYSMWWFQSPYGRQNIEEVASSTSGLYTLSISKVDSLVIPLPSLKEVEQVTEAIDEVFSKIGYLEEWCQTELTRSAALRQSILKDAFAGKLVPQDPDDEPATELLARIRAERDAKPKQRSREKATAS